jgi:hypothetical protein
MQQAITLCNNTTAGLPVSVFGGLITIVTHVSEQLAASLFGVLGIQLLTAQIQNITAANCAETSITI